MVSTKGKLRLKKLRSSKIVKISSYFIIFGLVIGLVQNGHAADTLVIAERQSSVASVSPVTSSSQGAPSVDQVVAANLAASLASGVDLPIATNISNQAISVAAKSELAQTSDELISKPQIVQPTAGRGVTIYKAKAGETVDTVAALFKLSKNTIKWSNDLQSDALEPGRELIISPVDGVVYTVQSGDSVQTLAQRYRTDAQRIILFNDLELASAINPGTRIIIPGGTVAAPVQSAFGRSAPAFSNVAAFTATGNGYDYGYCTWYAYNRRAALGRPISGGWGNASSWASYARQSGFSVSSKPSLGAVMQDSYTAGGYGHVAVVEEVRSDGSILVSEMNYERWNVKSNRVIPASSVGGYNFIN